MLTQNDGLKSMGTGIVGILLVLSSTDYYICLNLDKIRTTQCGVFSLKKYVWGFVELGQEIEVHKFFEKVQGGASATVR
jgi:hypothetical protein